MKELIQVIKEELTKNGYDVFPSATDTEIICTKDGTDQKFVILVGMKK